MPSPAPEPLAPRPLSFWLVDSCEDIPGEGRPPGRCWTLARILSSRGHDVIWWSSTWSHRRQATRLAPAGLREDEGFAVRLVAARPFVQPASLARLRSDRDFARTFERLASEMVAAGHLERPDVIIASLPPLEAAEAASRLAGRMEATLVVDVREPWPEFELRQVPGPAFLRPLLTPLLVGNLGSRQASLLAASDGVAGTTASMLSAFCVAARPDLPRHMCYAGSYVQEFGTPRRHLDPVPVSGAAAEALPVRPTVCVCTVANEEALKIVMAVARGLGASGLPITVHAVAVGPTDRPGGAPTGSGGPLVVHGPLPRQEYVRLLSAADIGVVVAPASSTGPHPDAVSDFAAAGLAIVHDLSGELADLLARHDAGDRCASGDTGALVRSIASLAGDRRRLLAMQDAARRLALASFDRERLYPQFADWLETLPG
jgi:hypothetical protein